MQQLNRRGRQNVQRISYDKNNYIFTLLGKMFIKTLHLTDYYFPAFVRGYCANLVDTCSQMSHHIS